MPGEDIPNYEEEFASRFTDCDQDYQEHKKCSKDTPPIMEDWNGIEGGSQRNRENRMPGEDILNYEEEFASRFTDRDQDYQEHKKCSKDTPPIVEDWNGIEGGSQRNRENRFEDFRARRGRGGGRSWSHDNYNRQRRGWGNGSYSYGHRRSYSSHPHGYQGYNTYDQHRNHNYY
ncbi:RNA guanine-N7 methyltransferase activating subunit isoform X2 [Protopterus annectens]|uniref:RNA guanine-N7 methyltransferase activating subunit isoform X2 n=1 Tax=Protopterus annectens TaxID=7888 RepID=UPI001CFA61A9|nr:RNA guanine-N7 methyltransferase activating subunit isoform X2 [Protopterus annectens]